MNGSLMIVSSSSAEPPLRRWLLGMAVHALPTHTASIG
jgi:hypothetical protein